jgi:hypothetical protein
MIVATAQLSLRPRHWPWPHHCITTRHITANLPFERPLDEAL